MKAFLRSFFRRSLTALALMLLAACSIMARDTLSPDAKVTIANLTQRYLSTMIKGDEVQLASYIAWSDYLGEGDNRITHQEFSRQLTRLVTEYEPTNPKHPLTGLRLKRITGDGDTALAVLEKGDGTSKEDIVIHWLWSGSGWLVLEDSLFGKEKLFARMFPMQQDMGKQSVPPILMPER